MTPEVKEALERAEELLHEALVAYSRDEAELDYAVDNDGQGCCCMSVGGYLVLAVIDPPVYIGDQARGQ